MKKNFSALLISAVFLVAAASCNKSQDVSPALSSNNSSNSVLAINDSATLTYKDSGVCAMIHGLPSQHNINFNGFTSFQATVWTYGGTVCAKKIFDEIWLWEFKPQLYTIYSCVCKIIFVPGR